MVSGREGSVGLRRDWILCPCPHVLNTTLNDRCNAYTNATSPTWVSNRCKGEILIGVSGSMLGNERMDKMICYMEWCGRTCAKDALKGSDPLATALGPGRWSSGASSRGVEPSEMSGLICIELICEATSLGLLCGLSMPRTVMSECCESL